MTWKSEKVSVRGEVHKFIAKLFKDVLELFDEFIGLITGWVVEKLDLCEGSLALWLIIVSFRQLKATK